MKGKYVVSCGVRPHKVKPHKVNEKRAIWVLFFQEVHKILTDIEVRHHEILIKKIKLKVL